ncbi:hypothetical protein GSI_03463 [Ganoderma sinense ZZ0214-1]|uniref:PIPK domain-containing protein n=1 Tax=Ganoderma sinense ZZ0214-1 TaxID=1077348 RepID=A0A2G8SLS1_9APHY|nr:hypothetical protein GSI_03463 [Ganoderma sinense ZZ0214-1]
MTLPLRHLLAVALFVPFLLAPAAVFVAARYALDILHDQLNSTTGDDEMEKPLPDLPTAASRRRTPSNLTLTVDARAHLHRFLLHTLGEESELREKDNWAERLGTALNDLGAGVENGGWLAGLRRARYVRKRHHDEEEKRRAEEDGRKDKEEEERARNRTAKGRSKLKEVVVEDEPVDDGPSGELLAASLEQLREAALRPVVPSAKPSMKHLFLSVSGPPSEPVEDMGFKLIRTTTLHCSFNPGEFALPKSASGEDVREPVVLYGLHEWDASLLSSDDPFQVVGGTFVFRGVTAHPQYHALCRVLRLAVFAYLSLLLEQDLLSNSDVELHYPKVTIPNLPTFPPTVERSSSSADVKEKQLRRRDSGSGLWSFLSKKTEDLLHRATHVSPLGRRGSVDLAFGQKVSRATSLPQGPDGGFLSRRLSMLSGSAAPRAPQESENEAQAATFAAVVKRMDAWKDLLSTSPNVAFPPPSFVLSIADKETQDPTRRPLGDEKAALSSLLGWQGKEPPGKGVVGVSGFVRHQGITVMYSEHVPGASVLSNPPALSKSDTASIESQIPMRTPCWGHRRKWINYRYYRCGRHWDESLGEAIIRWCEAGEDHCGHPDCQFNRGEHDMRWIHGGLRLLATVSVPTSSDASTSDDSVRMWVSCAVCEKESPKRIMHDGTYLISFAKFLELLVYSPAIHALSPPLCEHTTFPEKPWAPADTPIPHARFDIIRHFSHKGRVVTMTLADVREVFEVHVPRLQILRRKAGEKKPVPDPTPIQHPTAQGSSVLGESHKVLRREIMRWWQGLSDRMDQLEEKFVSDHPSSFHKSLPRLPSADDAYEPEDEEQLSTPKVHPKEPPSTPQTLTASLPEESNGTASRSSLSSEEDRTPRPSQFRAGSASTTDSVLTSSTDLSSSSTTADGADSLQLLAGLRFKFQQYEQELYSELAHTSEKNLNDVRRSFVTAARGATKRLAAWEKKHASGAQGRPGAQADVLEVPEPEWWKSGCHAVPGGNIIVREDDWGSIIAFTLSTADYQRELSNMSTTRSAPTPAAAPAPTEAATSSRPSIFRAPESFRRFVSGSTPHQPDPDLDDTGWQEPETYSAVISRKEHPREPAALAAIRDVLRQKPSADSGTSSSLLTAAGITSGRTSGTETPRSARAKPAVEVSTLAADGLVSGMPVTVESAGKILHELEAVSKANASRSSLSESRRLSSGFFEATIRRGKASSLMTDGDGSTIQDGAGSSINVTPPPLPPKDDGELKEGEEPPKGPGSVGSDAEQPPPTPAKSGFTSSFTNSLTSAMRYVFKPEELPRPPSGMSHHGLLLSADAPAIDERPHIKYDWTIGKRLRFSCTVYYAKQFDQLRRRCGVDDVFMRSMARSENWAAEGGKSRSNFWKTADNRFIIKTLVNAWNVADLQVLIDLGPSYFRYMEATASKATVLAKLLGFYTVEIRNLETGNTQAKADLLVMENLFFDRNITKTFDLKGIQGRKIKDRSGSHSKTLFDGEWIEGQQRALTLVRTHSKVVLQEAIKADCEFLARSNIMDYSLLLGVDEENKEMICGLVDTIGSYTFAKTLEYKAKQGLNSSKEVTVVPPHEYQERFVGAMDDYFLACPDKWTRPLDNTPVPEDYRDLPSVL